jgi:ABC-type Fe3+/spermidine/putrescine transport system ATPase subunit
MSEYLIVEKLLKRWPMKDVVISFAMDKGASLALLGPSGCGKSSVLRMIAGLLAPDSGFIILDGTDITALPPGQRRVGMVFQDHALFPHLSVEDNIGYGLVSQGMSRKESRASASEWLERFDLPGFTRRRIDTLSGGEKQRVALARTLAVNPRLVLFDEPLSALDAGLRKRLRAELRERQVALGYTAIYVTHDEDEAAVLADRIIRMDDQSTF